MFASHGFPPFFGPESRVLILGSFPSVKSREEAFYYAHPQNRFWKVLAGCFGDNPPYSLYEKKLFLSAHKIALWDAVESCDVIGSGDASIKNVTPTDVGLILKSAKIKKIILNGRTAEKYFLKYNPEAEAPFVTLPSTSPANAAWGLERLISVWRPELEFLEVD